MNKKIYIVFILFLFAVSGCKNRSGIYFDAAGGTSEAVILEEASEEARKEEPQTECFVHVCGAVVNPGVYGLSAGSRICDAIVLAGGLREDACAEAVNQAREITDGEMIRIPSEEEVAEGAGVVSMEEEAGSGKVNINTADAGALTELPGIGASKAAAILAYREENGGFSSVEEIKKIAGIKEGVYSKIKDLITVN